MDVRLRSRDGGTVTLSTARDDGDLVVLARKEVTPREVAALPAPERPAILVALWVSPRSQELLRAKGIGFLDATGNSEVVMSRPGMVIRTAGAERDPNPKPVIGPTLRGPRAWALLRTLIEVAPPYGVKDLSDRLGIDAGYVRGC